jgi:alanine racemase
VPRPILARISQAALAHNLAVARRYAGEAKVWAVVKANAYGHGLARAARGLAQADGFALLDLAEAVRLREAGVEQPILLLEGFFGYDDLPLFTEHRLTSVVHAMWQVELLEAVAASRALPLALPVLVKLNSGLNRLGFSPAQLRGAISRLQACAAVSSVTLMTHFADADGSRGIAAQLEAFHAASAGLQLPVSMANSAALLRFPEQVATQAGHAETWVRPGIMLYGCSPFADKSAAELGLKPAMTLTSEVIGLQELKAGDEVGYSGTFRAPASMRIGVVACGYADGYPRHAPTGTPVLVAGKPAATVGRVSMDMLTIDLTPYPDLGIGAPVTLWGEGLSADVVANHAGTVGYELLCALAARVPVVDV